MCVDGLVVPVEQVAQIRELEDAGHIRLRPVEVERPAALCVRQRGESECPRASHVDEVDTAQVDELLDSGEAPETIGFWKAAIAETMYDGVCERAERHL